MFFDNLQVRHDRGRILEESHYYAYGLKNAALSSKAFGGPNNNYQYQGSFNEYDDDLGWNDFTLRSYDPQTGRFLQNDPYEQFASGYVGMGNDPVNNVDPSGGFLLGASSMFNATLGGAVLGAVVGGGVALATGGNPLKGAAIGAGAGALAGLGSGLNWGSLAAGTAGVGSIVGAAGQTAHTIANDINKGGGKLDSYGQGSVIPVMGSDGFLLGNLSVKSYHSYTESEGGRGVYISLKYKAVNKHLIKYRYVQTVRTNKHKDNPIGNTYTFNDPAENGDDFPFYWDIPFEEDTENGLCNCDASFWDKPRRIVNSQHNIAWEGELSLVGANVISGKYQSMITLTYGFDINKNGMVVARPIKQSLPSDFQLKSINSYSLGVVDRIMAFIMSLLKK